MKKSEFMIYDFNSIEKRKLLYDGVQLLLCFNKK